jgi:50S ribosomal subunit-associated GTPase HflX
MIETRPQKSRERALLIGLEKEGVSKWELHDSLDELRELANSAGAEVSTQSRKNYRSRPRLTTSAAAKRNRSRNRVRIDR